MYLAPIALFVYKRPDHTKRTLEALMLCPECSESKLFVFCDGAKQTKDEALVQETRSVVRSLVGDKAEIIEASSNQGLANSIINGVTRLVDEYGQVIVLEDDLLVSPDFLNYMNQALNKYRDVANVMQISGYISHTKKLNRLRHAFFIPFANSWGWATWKRAWNQFDHRSQGWEIMKTDLKLRKEFNIDGCYNCFEMLKLQKSGEIDSWAIRWHWSIFKVNGVVLYPPCSYVNNIGKDGSGSHSSYLGNILLSSSFRSSKTHTISFPDTVMIDPFIYKEFKRSMLMDSYRCNLGILKRRILKLSSKKRP